MNTIKKIFLAILIILTIGVFMRGWFYRNLVSYRSIGFRKSYSVNTRELKDLIEENIDNESSPSIEQIIKLSLSITSQQLTFTTGKNEKDPNRLVNSMNAHCVGYASFFAATCNYLLKKHNLNNSWIAKPRIGQLYFLGTNLHNYFSSPFFKDHDFVTIENNKTGQILAVDPTVNDYLYIDFVTFVK